jgi:hypothetical protein
VSEHTTVAPEAKQIRQKTRQEITGGMGLG